MGKTIKWLKVLFGIKRESNSGDRKEKIPSCIRRSRRSPTNTPSDSPPMMNSVLNNNHEAQSRRAIAVAAVTAAAADAAVAAAQAAVAFVRLTNQNRVTTTGTGDLENSSAIKIQSLFRGYLSRKALKALKSLVKIQALVRGYLVRKEAIRTLEGMEALFRARSSVSAYKIHLQDDQFHPQRSIRDASEGRRSKRTSSSFQNLDDVRPNSIELDLEESKSKLTRANTWAWAVDQTPSPLSTNPSYLSLSASSNVNAFQPRFSTTHNTPRLAYSCGPDIHGSVYDGLSKDDSFASHPGYMANTKSFRAKVRSRSAPKQRPEFGLGLKKGDGLADMECELRMEKSKSPLGLKNSFKNYVMDWKVLKRSM